MGNISTRILLVEDYQPNIFMLEILLKEYGYNYDVATNGAEAIQYATSNTYDVILMDVGMPIMNGYDATEIIREYERQNNKPRSIIFGITARALVGDAEKCLNAGMDDYISKPINIFQFESKLKSCVQKQVLYKTA